MNFDPQIYMVEYCPTIDASMKDQLTLPAVTISLKTEGLHRGSHGVVKALATLYHPPPTFASLATL